MARYFLRFRHSDTGLTPTFNFFKRASDLTVVSPAPPVGEVGGGSYYFDYTPTFDIIFEVDGGVSIPTEEVRYISDTISPKDVFVDEPTSQVHDDVWNDTDNRAAGTKGDFVEQIGVPADTSAQATLFGKTLLYKESIRGDTAGTSDGNDVEEVYDAVVTANTAIGTPADTSATATLFGKTLLYKESVRGDTAGTSDGNDVEQVYDAVALIDISAVNTALTDIKGAGFVTGTDSLKVLSDELTDIKGSGFVSGDDSLKILSDELTAVKGAGWISTDNLHETKVAVDAINVETDPSAIATAVWSSLITGHQTADSTGRFLNDIFRLLKNKSIINPTTKQLEVYNDAGSSIVFTFDLKDENGVASATSIFQRLPL